LSRHEPHTAIDAAGNAIVVWTLEIRYTGWPFRGYVIQAARYIAATGSWSSPTDLSVESAVAQYPAIAVDASGNATAVWQREHILQAARYSAAAGAWTGPTNLSAVNGRFIYRAPIAIDGGGNVIVVWEGATGLGVDPIEVARYTAATGIWSSPTRLSALGHSGNFPRVAVDTAGNATVLWKNFRPSDRPLLPAIPSIQASRYVVATNMWSSARDIYTPTQWSVDREPELVVDTTGNVTAAWTRSVNLEGGPRVIQAARYTPATDTWSNAIDVFQSFDGFPLDLKLAADSAGNVTVVWRNEFAIGDPTFDVIRSTRWLAAGGGGAPLGADGAAGVGARRASDACVDRTHRRFASDRLCDRGGLGVRCERCRARD
jgi:hypothetical protein